jgi:hypothetical protein
MLGVTALIVVFIWLWGGSEHIPGSTANYTFYNLSNSSKLEENRAFQINYSVAVFAGGGFLTYLFKSAKQKSDKE